MQITIRPSNSKFPKSQVKSLFLEPFIPIPITLFNLKARTSPHVIAILQIPQVSGARHCPNQIQPSQQFPELCINHVRHHVPLATYTLDLSDPT